VPLEAKLVPPTVEGQAPPEPETGSADPEAGTSDCVIRLGRAGSSRAGSLTIRVVDPDGRPVPRARILIQSANMSMSTELTDGRFVHVRSETSGASVVHVRISGARDAEGAALPLAAAQMDVPASPSEVTIRLERSEPIRGVVRGPDGAPVVGATVQLLAAANPPSHEILAYAQTGDDGTFSLLGGPRVPGRVVVHALRGFLAPEPVDVAPGATGVDLRMRAGATAIVTVLDAGGAPVGGAKVGAIDEDPAPDSPMGRGEPTPPSVATDAAGRATLVGLDPARRYRLSVSPTSPGSRAAATPRWVPSDTTVRLERALRITGVVRDREGRPVSGARVQTLVGGAIGTYDVDGAGRFVLDGLPEGPVSLRAVPYPSSDGSFVPDIPLPRSGETAASGEGDPDPGSPCAPARPTWCSPGPGRDPARPRRRLVPERRAPGPLRSPRRAKRCSWRGRSLRGVSHGARIADDGTIRFHRLDASKTYTLWIAPVGDRSLRKSGVRAGADLRVRLEVGKTLSFRVIGPVPLGNVALTLVGCPLSVWSWRAVNEDGTVDLRGYPPGRYTVQASTSREGQAYMGVVTVERAGRGSIPAGAGIGRGR
jgi:protocatechuate 3,4-dioxygenase beta subunit